MPKNILRETFRKYVYSTVEKTPILEAKARVGKVKRLIAALLYSSNRKVYIRTRSLKHLYDKKPAEEFDFLINNLKEIINNPDFLYRDRNDKRGNFCLVAEIKGSSYIVVVEIVSMDDGSQEIQIVTAFRMRHDRYLGDYELLWSRRDGVSSSPHREAGEPD